MAYSNVKGPSLIAKSPANYATNDDGIQLTLYRTAGKPWGFSIVGGEVFGSVFVEHVTPGSCAESSGLLRGDRIVSIDSTAVESMVGRVTSFFKTTTENSLSLRVIGHEAVRVHVDSGNDVLEIELVRKKASIAWGISLAFSDRLGFIVVSSQKDFLSSLKRSLSPSRQAGVLPGDKVLVINGVETHTIRGGVAEANAVLQNKSLCATLKIVHRESWATAVVEMNDVGSNNNANPPNFVGYNTAPTVSSSPLFAPERQQIYEDDVVGHQHYHQQQQHTGTLAFEVPTDVRVLETKTLLSNNTDFVPVTHPYLNHNNNNNNNYQGNGNRTHTLSLNKATPDPFGAETDTDAVEWDPRS